jgi:hypothetical protein
VDLDGKPGEASIRHDRCDRVPDRVAAERGCGAAR